MHISSETAAIILDSRNYKESDKIVTLIAPQTGRFSGIAKGANKSKKRFLNKLELFSHLIIRYVNRKNSGLALIEDAELIDSFISIRMDVKRYAAASFIREVLLTALSDHQNETTIFNLACRTFHAVDNDKNPLNAVAIFLIRLYEHLGYCPTLSHCCSCGAGCDTRNFAFHYLHAGLICEQCLPRLNSNSTAISPGTIRLLQTSLTEPLSRLNRIYFSGQSLNQSLPILYKYGRNLFQREFQSWKLLKRYLTH